MAINLTILLYAYSKNAMNKIDSRELMTVTFPIAKLLKEKGFAAGSDSYYYVYQDDFLYDGDVSHPESHKKGEVRQHYVYNNNKYNSEFQYENPSIISIIYWLFSKGIIFSISLNDNKNFFINVKKFSEDKTILFNKSSIIEDNISFHDAFMKAISLSLNLIT